MADIFISYKSERRAAVRHLAEILSYYGYSVWFDNSLVKGRDYSRQIEDQIRVSRVVLVLWCKLSVKSDWVAEEADLATQLARLSHYG